MNKQIKKLAEQAFFDENTNQPSDKMYTFSEHKMQQFAELIVRECIEACSRANEIRHFVPPTQEQVVLSCMREIEQYFGVEE